MVKTTLLPSFDIYLGKLICLMFERNQTCRKVNLLDNAKKIKQIGDS